MGKLRHRSYPVLNRKGQYLGMIGSANLLDAKKKKIILVDHTEKSQAVDNLDEAEILEIVDHHRVGTVETINPIYFRGEPVGCTCTHARSCIQCSMNSALRFRRTSQAS